MDEFDGYRQEMNEKLLGSNHLGIKRFFALDTQVYENGALDRRTKEMLGLVASIVLRCDDCITYHIKQCVSAGNQTGVSRCLQRSSGCGRINNDSAPPSRDGSARQDAF